MPRFAAGVVKFQEQVFPDKKELFQKLTEGQSPEALFITCSDSRIETAMITQTDPGDLFICRNAGNIVPPYDQDHTGAVTATLEFAVAALNVPHIVVCGHTDCGAMHGALHPERVAELPHVKEWLSFTKDALEKVEQTCAGKSDSERLHKLLEENVILQIEHLKTHPSVRKRLEEGSLRLHGWIYDIGSGEIHAWDEETKHFQPVNEAYADSIR